MNEQEMEDLLNRLVEGTHKMNEGLYDEKGELDDALDACHLMNTKFGRTNISTLHLVSHSIAVAMGKEVSK